MKKGVLLQKMLNLLVLHMEPHPLPDVIQLREALFRYIRDAFLDNRSLQDLTHFQGI